MKQHLKTLVLGGTLVVGSLGTMVALAQTSGSQASGGAGQMQGQMQPNLNGSIKLPQDNQSESAEAAAYMNMAKVTLDQAVKAAQSSLGNTAAPSSAQLGNENGSLVWEVVIGKQTVIVDAGNAKVLQTQATNAAEMADNGENYDQGQDGETNDQMNQGKKQQGNAQQEQGGEYNNMEDGN